jgi:hypothetical protein
MQDGRPMASGSFTAGKKSFSRTEPPLSKRWSILAARQKRKQKRIEFLEKKVQTKDEVLAELMAEHITLKKKPWGTLPAA